MSSTVAMHFPAEMFQFDCPYTICVQLLNCKEWIKKKNQLSPIYVKCLSMLKVKFKIISTFLDVSQNLDPGTSLVVFIFKCSNHVLHCVNGLGALGFLVTINYIIGSCY